MKQSIFLQGLENTASRETEEDAVGCSACKSAEYPGPIFFFSSTPFLSQLL